MKNLLWLVLMWNQFLPTLLLQKLLAFLLRIFIETKYILIVYQKVLFVGYKKWQCSKYFFIFDQKYYKQCDGVAMDSPHGPTLTNVFKYHFENIWSETCPTQFKPVVYRCMDDTFLLFCSTEHAEKFNKYLNKQHKNIAFTSKLNKLVHHHF